MKYIALITSFLTSLTNQSPLAVAPHSPSGNGANGITQGSSQAHEQQLLISRVLNKIDLRKELFGTYKSALIRISSKSSDVQAWLVHTDRYLNSKDFSGLTETLQQEVLADNRRLLEITIQALAS